MDFEKPTSAYTERIRNFLCGILQICGLWKPFEQSKSRQDLYSVFSFVFLLIFCHIFALAMVMNIFFLTNITELAERLFMSLTELGLYCDFGTKSIKMNSI